MSDRRYRVAIVGGAGMWGKLYLRAAAELEQVDPILVDPSPRREEFAADLGVTEVYEDLDAVLAKETPDVVCNILPVGIAHEFVEKCAKAGVRVISCEKPIAVELSIADSMVQICRQHGAAFGCATAHWEVPFLQETADWIAAGNIGDVTSVAIPGGLPVEVSGAGCVQLTQMRGLTGLEVEWVEGFTLPPVEGYRAPEADELTMDCPAYGRMGLTGGVICEVPQPRGDGEVACRVSVTGTQGQVFAQGHGNVYLVGTGAGTSPVFPEFTRQEGRRWSMGPMLQRLLDAVDSGALEVPCSGHDYRQALEIAIAFKLSAANDNQRVALPLEDRSQKILPHPYRRLGGDVAGYESIGYKGPPESERRTPRTAPGSST
jgi:predicted dehydrogenase